jgi:hypothetical protein
MTITQERQTAAHEKAVGRLRLQQKVLKLREKGHTNVAIGKELGMSESSIRRIVKTLGEIEPIVVDFNSQNPNWRATPEYNVMFLRQVENYLNQKLRVRGHMLLPEVLEELGFPVTLGDEIRGWIYANGDVIDFGIWEDDKVFSFAIGQEDSITLGFINTSVVYRRV